MARALTRSQVGVFLFVLQTMTGADGADARKEWFRFIMPCGGELFRAIYILWLQRKSGTRPVSEKRRLSPHNTLDLLVRMQLQKWPQRPPGVVASPKQPGTWLRGRPGEATPVAQPFLKLPGSKRLRTLPDGLWLHFGPTAHDSYVDIFGIM